MLKKLPFKKTVLFVMPSKDAAVLRSCRNIENVKPLLVSNLNIADLMNYQDVLFLKDSLKKLEETYIK
jgi:ribosomal protein L4